MYSVAKLDYGLISRVIQDELTPIEMLLIARHRPLAVTLKLSKGGTGPDGMIGHAITFAQRGPQSLIPVLPTIDDDLRNRMHVTFVGRRGMPENVATFLLHVPSANVRPYFVINYIRILKDIDPCYADLEINDSNEVHQAMAALPGQLVDTRQVIDDDTLVQLDRVALGNPAHSVDHPDMQPLHDDEQNAASV